MPPAAVADTVTVASAASTLLSGAVSFTVPVLVSAPAAIVSVRPPSSAAAAPDVDTVNVTASLERLLRLAVTSLAPPSRTVSGARLRLTVGVASSSSTVSVTAAGSATPLPPAAVADTVTVASAASTLLSGAVSFTAPVLVSAPTAIVNVPPPSSAAPPPDADTFNVTASLERLLRLAVTSLAPPSRTVSGARLRLTVGTASSSKTVSVTEGGSATPLPPAAVADTVTVASAASTLLSGAVSFTVPVLVSAPAAIVSVLTPASAAASPDVDTVNVTASLERLLRLALTSLAPPSRTVPGARLRLTVGVASSSFMTPVAVRAVSSMPAFTGVPNVTVMVSSGSSRLSPLTGTMIAVRVTPARMVRCIGVCT